MREINESFINHKEFENWAKIFSNSESVYKIKIDNGSIKYMSIIIYPDFDNLILLSPLEISEYEDHKYETYYPQIGPIYWKELCILEELDELEAVKEITDDDNIISLE